MLPIAIFLTRYALAGNFLQLFRGVSGSIEGHLQFVNSRPSVMKFVVGISVNLFLAALVFLTRSRVARAIGILFWVGIPIILFLARAHPYVDRSIWGTLWSFLPFVVVAGTVLLVFRSMRGSLDTIEQQKVLLVLSVCATANLIQFPFTAASYYCHVAPFAFLAATALVSRLEAPPRVALAGHYAFAFCI